MEDNLMFCVQLTPDEVEYLLQLVQMEVTDPVESSDVSDAISLLLKTLKDNNI